LWFKANYFLSNSILFERSGLPELSCCTAVKVALGSGATMDSRTKHDIWIMTVSTLVTVAVATIAFAALSVVH
jgi:hypothetical protein